MNPNRVAVFPGSFDPVHFGHIDVIDSTSQLFEKVIWAIGTNQAKAPMFKLEDRVEMLRRANVHSNVVITPFSGLLVPFALSRGAGVIIRSLRMVSMDFEYEFQMTLINRHLSDRVHTVYLPARQEHMHINSTAVRELLRNNEDVSEYLPESVRDYAASILGR